MNDWVELLCTYDETEAQIVKDIIESEGIEVVCKSLKISPYPVNIGRIGEVRLLVKAGDLQKSQGILKIMQDNQEEDLK